jgi:hypothetical protein
LNVSAVNSAFKGGQNARSYQTVSAHDIESAAASLKRSLEQSAQAALQTQVHSDESLIVPVICAPKITTDHQPGEETRQVQIQLTETCTSMAYSTQAFNDLVTQIVSQSAS